MDSTYYQKRSKIIVPTMKVVLPFLLQVYDFFTLFQKVVLPLDVDQQQTISRYGTRYYHFLLILGLGSPSTWKAFFVERSWKGVQTLWTFQKNVRFFDKKGVQIGQYLVLKKIENH